MARRLHQRTFFSFIFAAICLSFCTVATSSEYFNIRTICLGYSGFQQNVTYQNNVHLLLSNLSDASSNRARPPLPGFFNTTVGEVPNKAYGTYYCRGDIDTQLCHDCVINATRALTKERVNFECFGYDDQCMVHYADRNIFSLYERGSVLSNGVRGLPVSNYQQYNKTLSSTLGGLVKEAALGNWTTTNFETRVANVTGSDQKIYTLVQCTPDISAMNCSACLDRLNSYITRCCSLGQSEAYVIHGNCMLKYSNQSFFGGDAVAHSGAYHGFVPRYYYHVSIFVAVFSIYFLHM